MIAMFLGPIEKEGKGSCCSLHPFDGEEVSLYVLSISLLSDLRNIFTVLSEHKDAISVPPAMLKTMKRSYGV